MNCNTSQTLSNSPWPGVMAIYGTNEIFLPAVAAAAVSLKGPRHLLRGMTVRGATALPRRRPAQYQIGVSRPSAKTSVPLPQKLTCPIVSSASPIGPGRVQAPSGTVVCPAWTLKYVASPLYGQ